MPGAAYTPNAAYLLFYKVKGPKNFLSLNTDMKNDANHIENS
jgi:hypothetical protein